MIEKTRVEDTNVILMGAEVSFWSVPPNVWKLSEPGERLQTHTQILSDLKPHVSRARLMELLASSFSISSFIICHDLKMSFFFLSRNNFPHAAGFICGVY